ncbi:MAG: hypothetical protein IPH20_06880 [Bacteroidales bacterium]|nr:hypothetical protein [Bacteroidales bacterium]
MKTTILCLLAVAFSFSSCSEKKSQSIDGAWKLVQSQTVTGNSVVTDFPGKIDMDLTKIWAGNHWMFVARIKADTTVTEAYGDGTFKLEGNRYEENVSILVYKPWEGKTIKMTLELKNDTITQTYPVDDNGEMDKNGATIEKYVRIME